MAQAWCDRTASISSECAPNPRCETPVRTNGRVRVAHAGLAKLIVTWSMAISLFAISPAGAQDDAPEVAAARRTLLAMAEQMQSVQTIDARLTMTLEVQGGGQLYRSQSEYELHAARPNRISIRLVTGSIGWNWACDGQTLWVYSALSQQYLTRPAPPTFEDILMAGRDQESDMLFGLWKNNDPSMFLSTLLPAEVKSRWTDVGKDVTRASRVQLGKVDCWQFTAELGPTTAHGWIETDATPQLLGLSLDLGATVAEEARQKLPLEYASSKAVQAVLAKLRVTASLGVRDWKLGNEPAGDPAAYAFEPPETWRSVDRLPAMPAGPLRHPLDFQPLVLPQAGAVPNPSPSEPGEPAAATPTPLPGAKLE